MSGIEDFESLGSYEQEKQENLQPHFPWFNLPKELRLLILEFALTRDLIIEVRACRSTDIAACIALFRVCRQMTEEAYPIFYRRNTFGLFPPDYREVPYTNDDLVLRRLSPRCKSHVTSVNFHLGGLAPFLGKIGRLEGLGLDQCPNLRIVRVTRELDSRRFIMSLSEHRAFLASWHRVPVLTHQEIFWNALLDKAPTIREAVFDVSDPKKRRQLVPLMQILNKRGVRVIERDYGELDSVHDRFGGVV